MYVSDGRSTNGSPESKGSSEPFRVSGAVRRGLLNPMVSDDWIVCANTLDAGGDGRPQRGKYTLARHDR
jgi:hypothetical protein